MRMRLALITILAASLAASAQTFPQPTYFQRFFVKPHPTQSLPGPEALSLYVKDGKLRLALADAVRLTILNNPDVRANQLQIDLSRWAITKAYAPFDPTLNTYFNASRAVSPTSSQLQGAGTLSTLDQPYQSQYNQLFETGTQYQVTFGIERNVSNSLYSTINPYINAGLTAQITQPLLRNRGLFPNRATILIAQRNLKQSRSGFQGQINDAILRAVNAYWDVVQARENLQVLQESLDLAEATYKRNRRELELGALPPLDIYRSESQVAQRRLSVIQAEYSLKQFEDTLRQQIGADLDPAIGALDLNLTEPTDIIGDLAIPAFPETMEKALKARPELDVMQQQLAIDDTNAQLAHNSMLPDLSVTSFYSTNGLGGNQIDTTGATPVVVSRGGLSDAFDQLSSLNFPSYGLGITLRLPLRNRGAEADLGTALASKRRDLYQLRSRQQSIALEVKNAIHNFEQAKLSVAAAKIARDLSQKNLEAEQRKYELGTETIFFVLDAQNQLAQAEQSVVQAQIGYQRAVAGLDHTTAELIQRYNISMTP